MNAEAILRAHLAAKRVRPKDLAQALGIDRSSASLMLRGRRGIPTWHLDAIAAHLQMSVPALFVATEDCDENRQSRTESASETTGADTVVQDEHEGTVLAPHQRAGPYDLASLASTREALERIAADLAAVAEQLPRRQAAVDRRARSGGPARARKHRRQPARARGKKAPSD